MGMNCWICKTELIWGGDQDLEDDDDHAMMTNLSCPKCNALVFVYYGESKPPISEPVKHKLDLNKKIGE